MRALGMPEPAAGCGRAGGEAQGRAPRGCWLSARERHGEARRDAGPERCPRTGAWAERRAGAVVSRRRRLRVAGGSRRSLLSAPRAPAGMLPLRLWQEL